MKIGIIPNTNYDSKLEFTSEIVFWLKKNNWKPYLKREDVNSCVCTKELETIAVNNDEFYEGTECLLVLGGDGTILHTALDSAIRNIPIMGINIGTLGYLTDIDKNQWELALENLINGNYKLEKRMMLTAYIENSATENILHALNEVAIVRGNTMQALNSALYINGEYIDSYRGDGLLVATPTGSTAYNLSAGGPILKPEGKMIAITPLAPHTLYARPFVVPSSDIVSIRKVEDDREGNLEVHVDGKQGFSLNEGETLYIKQSKYITTTIKTIKKESMGFYDILRKKMVGSK